MITQAHFRELIIQPVLSRMGAWSIVAEELLIATAAHESGLGKWLRQLGSGPALGVYQCEPATHDDIYTNYLAYRGELREIVEGFEIPGLYDNNNAQELAGNLYYATAIARCHYLRVPEALPPPDDVEALAQYYKAHYNTRAGSGSTGEFIANYHRLVTNGKQD